MARRNLTAANAILLLSVTGLYLTPQRIQGFSTDDAFDVESVEGAEVMMGVDGLLSGGFIPKERKMTITLQADSLSNDFFDNWVSAQDVARELYIANGSVAIPSLSKKYTLTRGILTTYKPLAGVKKVLQPRSFGITWQAVAPAPF
jgi:hypothetical protein